MQFSRYAIFYTVNGPLAEFGARWLGWDSALGVAHDHRAALTGSPRKYGFHATLKPPFVLGANTSEVQLFDAMRNFASAHSPVALGRFEITPLARFLALTAPNAAPGLAQIAEDIIRVFDPFRAASSAEETARRDGAHLSARQRQNLTDWGYPYVMADFRFHMTLTSRLARSELEEVQEELNQLLAPLLVQPYSLDSISLMGEAASDGQFHVIERIALAAS